MAEAMNREKREEIEILSGGTMTEALAGAGAIVLTILSLSNVLPVVLLAIATIGVGGGLFFQGSTIAAEYSKLIDHVGGEGVRRMNIGGGISMKVMTGIGGIALGILGLVGIVPHILLPIAAITLGCGVALSSTSISRLNKLKIMHAGMNTKAQNVAGEAVSAASGAQVLIGLGAITLGILGLIGVTGSYLLTVIAILALGVTTLITGLSLSGRAMRTI